MKASLFKCVFAVILALNSAGLIYLYHKTQLSREELPTREEWLSLSLERAIGLSVDQWKHRINVWVVVSSEQRAIGVMITSIPGQDAVSAEVQEAYKKRVEGVVRAALENPHWAKDFQAEVVVWKNIGQAEGHKNILGTTKDLRVQQISTSEIVTEPWGGVQAVHRIDRFAGKVYMSEQNLDGSRAVYTLGAYPDK